MRNTPHAFRRRAAAIALVTAGLLLAGCSTPGERAPAIGPDLSSQAAAQALLMRPAVIRCARVGACTPVVLPDRELLQRIREPLRPDESAAVVVCPVGKEIGFDPDSGRAACVRISYAAGER